MGERRTLWLAGSAARVKKPCWIFACDGLQLQRTAREQSLIVGIFGTNHGVKGRDFIDKGRERTGKICRCHADPSARIFKNVSELSRMQLGVDRNRAESGMPGRVHRLQVLRAILHGQSDPVARPHPCQGTKPGRKSRNAIKEAGIIGVTLGAHRDSWPSRKGPGRRSKKTTYVHGRSYSRPRMVIQAAASS